MFLPIDKTSPAPPGFAPVSRRVTVSCVLRFIGFSKALCLLNSLTSGKNGAQQRGCCVACKIHTDTLTQVSGSVVVARASTRLTSPRRGPRRETSARSYAYHEPAPSWALCVFYNKAHLRRYAKKNKKKREVRRNRTTSSICIRLGTTSTLYGGVDKRDRTHGLCNQTIE